MEKENQKEDQTSPFRSILLLQNSHHPLSKKQTTNNHNPSDLSTSDDPHATEKTYLKPYPLLFHLPHLPSDKRGSHQLALVPAGHQVHLTLSFVPPHLSQHTREALPENPFSHLHHLHIPLQQKHNKNTSEITRKTRPKPKDPIQKNPP